MPARSLHQSPSQSPIFQSLKRTNVKILSKVRVNSSLPPSRRPRRKHSLAHNHRRRLPLQLPRPPLPRRALARPSQASTRCLLRARTANHLFAPAAEAQAAVVWHLTFPCTSLASRRAGTSRRCETWTRRRSRLTRWRKPAFLCFIVASLAKVLQALPQPRLGSDWLLLHTSLNDG